MLITEALARRPTRPADHEAVQQALSELLQTLADTPSRILAHLVERARTLCRAHSAGICLPDDREDLPRLAWHAVSGQWTDFSGWAFPRSGGALGACWEREGPQLLAHPERQGAFPPHLQPLPVEMMLVRCDAADRPVALLWIVSHDDRQAFDREDARVLTALGRLASAACVMRTDRRDLSAADESIRRLNAESDARVEARTNDLLISQESLRALTTELNLTVQRERQQLATELHDYLAQLLALTQIRLEQADRQAMPDPLRRILQDTRAVMDQALTYTRTLVNHLCPPIVKEFGLVMALQWLADQMRRQDLTITLSVQHDPQELSQEHAMLLFQAVRELLLNIVKHAATQRAWISVSQSEGRLRISVRDHGAGFDGSRFASTSHESGAGFGLFGIRERLLSLGGRLDITAQPGQGTEAVLSVPLEQPADDETVRPPQPASFGRVPTRPATFPMFGITPVHDRAAAAPQPPRLRVLIVDDHPMVRQGLVGLLANDSTMEVVAEASHGREAVDFALQLKPDVILMDVNMPVMSGIDATSRILRAMPAVKIIGLSVEATPYMEDAMKAAGAVAFLNKDEATTRLHDTLLSVCRVA